jgi:hypothetical protein
MTGIQVSADGYVQIGSNEWVSLEQIQEAVLRAQNPGLRKIATTPDKALEVVNAFNRGGRGHKEDHLPMPQMNFSNPNKDTEKQTRGDDGGHLPLPSMNFDR